MIDGSIYGILHQIDASPEPPMYEAPEEVHANPEVPPQPSTEATDETPSFPVMEMLQFAVIPTLLMIGDELLREQK